MLHTDISRAGALRHLTAPEVAFTRDEVHALDRRRFLQLVGLMGISMDRKVWSQLQKLGTCFHGT
jgi:hypothetical protein